MAEAASASPPLPWKTRIAVACLSAVTDAARRRDGTVNRCLINLLDVRYKPAAGGGVHVADFTLDPSRHLWVRVFRPAAKAGYAAAAAPLPVVVFFHGGGFVFLSPASAPYDAVCRRFARELPAVVVSVNYRLSPEHKFPAQYDDGADVLRWVDVDPEFSLFAAATDTGRLFLAGDSAGANLAHHVAVRFATAPDSFRRVRIAGVVSIQPFFGGTNRTESETRLKHAAIVNLERTDWMWRAFLPKDADRDHPAANVYGPRSTDEISRIDYPPTVVFVGGWDPLQDRQRKYVEWLKDKGKDAHLVEYTNAIHAFYIFPELPEASLLMNEVKEFVKKQAKRAQVESGK